MGFREQVNLNPMPVYFKGVLRETALPSQSLQGHAEARQPW